MYIGMEGWLVPMFQAEIVPAQIRGVVVNSYVFNHVFGSFIMSCVTYGTSKITTDMCWKIPVAVMFIIPSIVLLLVWMIPESPRWLVRKGRDEEALKWLKYIYGENPEYAPEAELRLLKEALNQEVEKGGWMDLLRGTNRVSYWPCMLNYISDFESATNSSPGYHSIIESADRSGLCKPVRDSLCQEFEFHRSISVHPHGQWTWLSGANCHSFAHRSARQAKNVSGLWLAFMRGTLDNGRLGPGNRHLVPKSRDCGHDHHLSSVLHHVLWWNVSDRTALLDYVPTNAGRAPVMGAELPSLHLRDKSAFVGWSIQNLAAFVVTFTVPYLLDEPYAALHSKVGFIYGAICLLGLVWAWFEFPELMGR